MSDRNLEVQNKVISESDMISMSLSDTYKMLFLVPNAFRKTYQTLNAERNGEQCINEISSAQRKVIDAVDIFSEIFALIWSHADASFEVIENMRAYNDKKGAKHLRENQKEVQKYVGFVYKLLFIEDDVSAISHHVSQTRGGAQKTTIKQVQQLV